MTRRDYYRKRQRASVRLRQQTAAPTSLPTFLTPFGYIVPADKLNGMAEVIFAERDRKLEEAQQRRQQARHAARGVARWPALRDKPPRPGFRVIAHRIRISDQ